MLNFSFFASGVWEAQGFICTAHRGLNRHAERESLAQTCIVKQGQTSNLNKINTEFFSDSVKKNSQHVLTERSLVYKFSARAGTDLDLKTKVCPSFMLNFSFFASGVWETPGFICTAHRVLNRHAKRESLAQTFIAKQGQT